MRNANVEPIGLVAPTKGVFRTGVMILAGAVVVAALIAVFSVALDMGESGADTASRTQAEQAEAERLMGLGGAASLGEVVRRQQAESARWQALAENYRQERAEQAEADRLTGLAGHHAADSRSQSEQAEADRLMGLASP